MTEPTGAPPLCSVWVDGVRMADGQPLDDELAPTVLTDLAVTWGRPNTLDQPAAATAAFEVMDLAGGQSFASQLHIGAKVDIRTDATIFPDPTLEMLPDPGFELGKAAWSITNGRVSNTGVVHSGTNALKVEPIDATKPITLNLLPAPLSSDPSAWNLIPRSVIGQRWDYSAWVWLSSELGVLNQAVTVQPVAYTNPNGRDPVLLTGTAPHWGPGGPAGWSVGVGSFLPPDDVWLGLRFVFYPTGPRWTDVAPAVTWDSLGFGTDQPSRTNFAPSPRADTTGDVSGWTTSRWFGSGGGAGTWSKVSGINGPVGITTASRKTWTVAPTANGDTGFLVQRNATDMFAVTPGQVVTLSGYLRATSVGQKIFRQVAYVYDRSVVAGAVNLGIIEGPTTTVNDANGVWQRVAHTFTVPAGAYGMRVVPDVDGGTGIWAVGDVLDCTGVLIEVGSTLGDYFDGATPDGVYDYAWSGAAHASTSTAVPVLGPRWDVLNTLRLDDVSLLAPAGGVALAALVFSGRITDLDARFDLGVGATVVKVIAADDTAELANRYVGDTPWQQSTLTQRFADVISVSGQSISYAVAPTVGSQLVSYRDVDSQPALRLLQELASSVAGVLWTATSLVTGPVLKLDDVAARPALHQLRDDGTGIIRIYIRDPVPTSGVTVSACNLLLEPVRWHQASDDDSTEVTALWLDQAPDPLSPVQRSVTLLDPVAERATGKRRISVTTQLSTEAGALSTASVVLARTRTPGWRISGLSWSLNPYEMLSPDDLDVIMRLLDGTTRMGLPMIITEIPAWAPITDGTGITAVYVEGGRFTNTDGYWTLDLLVSDAASQGKTFPWQDLPADWLWSEFASDIDWLDLSGVGL